MPKPKQAPRMDMVGESTVSKETQVDEPTIIPLSKVPDSTPKPARRGNLLPPSKPGLGGNTYSDKTFEPLFTQPIGKKGEYGRNKWADTALVLVHRAKKASQTYGKKDFNALYRLVLSAGIAFDKAFPQQVQPLGGNLVVQLFGSLGADTARRILEPARPAIIDVTPTVADRDPRPSEAGRVSGGSIPTGDELGDITLQVESERPDKGSEPAIQDED